MCTEFSQFRLYNARKNRCTKALLFGRGKWTPHFHFNFFFPFWLLQIYGEKKLIILWYSFFCCFIAAINYRGESFYSALIVHLFNLFLWAAVDLCDSHINDINIQIANRVWKIFFWGKFMIPSDLCWNMLYWLVRWFDCRRFAFEILMEFEWCKFLTRRKPLRALLAIFFAACYL